MPTPAKNSENMHKHLTKAELEARGEAEQDVIPDRDPADLGKPPKMLKGNGPARAYWNTIVSRMNGLQILDDLDCEMLAVYCAMLARYDDAQTRLTKLKKVDLDHLSGTALSAFLSGLLGLESKQQALEKNMLSYAEKLGLTPSGRARLAAKRADAVTEADPNDDLFG